MGGKILPVTALTHIITAGHLQLLSSDHWLDWKSSHKFSI